MTRRHEIPTHLNIEDRALYGLTVRQVMYLTVGAAGGYEFWNQCPALPLLVRALLVAPPLLLALIFALVHPHGRSLDDWLFIALHHVAVPKVSVWRPREPESEQERRDGPGWEELAPRIAWQEERR
ncbi:MAG: PrgI family protein [Chloroflexota bacterium]|nr:PrgI family protein [Chloroflexota bacterium]